MGGKCRGQCGFLFLCRVRASRKLQEDTWQLMQPTIMQHASDMSDRPVVGAPVESEVMDRYRTVVNMG